MMRKHRLCLAVATELTVIAFLLEHLRALQEEFEVTIVANTQNPNFLVSRGLQVEVVPIRIEREIAPWRDFGALRALVALFRSRRFDIVHSYTPKAGLLSMCAAFLASVPVRVHTFTGQVWATQKGLRRLLLRQGDRTLARAATHLLADSPSQREFLVSECVAPETKIRVIGAGSVAGVPLNRYRADPAMRRTVRESLEIADDAVVFCFVGRLKREKGLLTLATAFSCLAAERSNAHLLVIGPDEEGLAPRLQAVCPPDRLHLVGYTETVENYLAASDVLCLPSHREGFGSVIIEAAAAGVPSIASKIYGISDAVIDGVTGVLHSVGDAAALHGEMRRMLDNPAHRLAMSEAARKRVAGEFSSTRVTGELLAYYRSLLAPPRRSSAP